MLDVTSRLLAKLDRHEGEKEQNYSVGHVFNDPKADLGHRIFTSCFQPLLIVLSHLVSFIGRDAHGYIDDNEEDKGVSVHPHQLLSRLDLPPIQFLY